MLQLLECYLHSFVQTKACFKVLKKGRHLFVTLEMNLLRATTLPVRDYTSSIIFGANISRIALIFFVFASIPLCDTMELRNFLEETPKAHLDEFSFILYCLSVLNVSLRSSRWSSSSLLLTSMSFTYTSTFLPIYLLTGLPIFGT